MELRKKGGESVNWIEPDYSRFQLEGWDDRDVIYYFMTTENMKNHVFRITV
jgi:hypothetical protein